MALAVALDNPLTGVGHEHFEEVALDYSGEANPLVSGLATYAANSAFHNYLDSSTLLFVYVGGSVALARLASRERVAREAGSA